MRQSEYCSGMQQILSALSDPTCRAALALVRDGDEHCVCELMARLGASRSGMSRHTKVLRDAGLVRSRRGAEWVRSRRNPELAPELPVVIDAVLAVECRPEKEFA